MEKTHRDFRDLLLLSRQGDQEATRELVERFWPHIKRIIRRKLRVYPLLRRLFDSEDFAQTTMLEFFSKGLEQGRFETEQEMAAFLSEIAESSILGAARQYLDAQKRDLRRQEPLPSPALHQHELAARILSPAEAAEQADEWEHLLQGLPARYRMVLEMRRAGHTEPEIAQATEIPERVIRRFIERAAARALTAYERLPE
jgi:RNA polymerase sigma factor (sigma-70 family)